MKKRRGGLREGAGRKPRPPELHRRNRLMLNLTDAEYDRLLAAAKGRPPATFAREIVLRDLARRR